jgi:hypothetical protein
MKHESLDVVEEPPTLLDGVEYRGKVVIREDNIRSVLGNITASLALR